MSRTLRIMIGLGLIGAMLGVARVQPPADHPPPDRPPPDRREPGQEPRVETREELTARLQSRLDRVKADQDRLVKALDALAAGKPVEEVRDGMDAGRAGRNGRGEGRPGGSGPRAGEPGRPGPAIDRPRVLGFLQEHMPEIHARLEELKAADERAYDRFMGMIERRVHDIMTERDADLRAARIAEFRHGARVLEASRRLADLVRKAAPETELNAARESLRPLLAEQFDLRLEVKKLEIVALERRVEKLRTEAEGQSSNRDKAVEDGLARIEKFAKERHERQPPP